MAIRRSRPGTLAQKSKHVGRFFNQNIHVICEGKINLLYFSQIDLEELMRALKQDRTAKTVLNNSKGKGKGKGSHGLKQSPEKASDSDNVGDGQKQPAESTEENVPTAKESRSSDPVGAEELEVGGEGGESSSRAETKAHETTAAEQRQQRQDDKEDIPLFSLEEAESLTAYLVESQQAFSLINVADIQRGKPRLVHAQLLCRHHFRFLVWCQPVKGLLLCGRPPVSLCVEG